MHHESSVSLAIQYVLPHTENQHSSNLFLTYVIHHGSDSDIQGDTDTCPQCLEEGERPQVSMNGCDVRSCQGMKEANVGGL